VLKPLLFLLSLEWCVLYTPDRGMMNKEWHRGHQMPARATEIERVKWHLEHAEACGCRPFPTGLVAQLNVAERRKIEQLQRSAATRGPAEIN
jgi:hypothetical protein